MDPPDRQLLRPWLLLRTMLSNDTLQLERLLRKDHFGLGNFHDDKIKSDEENSASTKTESDRGARSGVSKGVEKPRRLPALRAANPEMAVRLFHGWPPTGHRKVGHGGR
jgi:hypothetical protein